MVFVAEVREGTRDPRALLSCSCDFQLLKAAGAERHGSAFHSPTARHSSQGHCDTRVALQALSALLRQRQQWECRSEYTSLHTSGSKTCHATPLLPTVRGSMCLQQSVHLERAALLRHSETLHMGRRRAAIYAKAMCTQTRCSASCKGRGCDGGWLLLPCRGRCKAKCLNHWDSSSCISPQTKPELTAEKENAPFDLLIGAACS